MPTDILNKVGTQISFGVHGSLSPAAAETNLEIGTPTDVEITLASLADGSGRASAKFDFGATRAEKYSCMASIEQDATTPVSGNTFDFYLAPSPSGTAGTANIAGTDGLDAAAPGSPLGSITLAEYLLMCIKIGTLVTTDDGNTVITGYVGTFSPPERYGQLVVVNNSGATLVSDNVEHHVVFNPIIKEIQN